MNDQAEAAHEHDAGENCGWYRAMTQRLAKMPPPADDNRRTEDDERRPEDYGVVRCAADAPTQLLLRQVGHRFTVSVRERQRVVEP